VGAPPLIPQLATPLLVLVPAAAAWDAWSAVRAPRLDNGLLDKPLASLFEWLGIGLAYGGPLLIADYASLIVFHVGILLLLASHAQHLAWVAGLLPARATVSAGAAAASAALIIPGFIVHAAITAYRRAGFRASMAPGVLLAASAASAVAAPGSPLHAYLGLASVYAALATRPGRHFLATAWARPLRALAAKLYGEG